MTTKEIAEIRDRLNDKAWMDDLMYGNYHSNISQLWLDVIALLDALAEKEKNMVEAVNKMERTALNNAMECDRLSDALEAAQKGIEEHVDEKMRMLDIIGGCWRCNRLYDRDDGETKQEPDIIDYRSRAEIAEQQLADVTSERDSLTAINNQLKEKLELYKRLNEKRRQTLKRLRNELVTGKLENIDTAKDSAILKRFWERA